MIYEFDCVTCRLLKTVRDGWPRHDDEVAKFQTLCVVCARIRGAHAAEHPHGMVGCRRFLDDITPIHVDLQAIEVGLR